MKGQMVTDAWIGDPNDPPAGTAEDFSRGTAVVLVAGVFATVLTVAALSTY
jgi:hypothetical protein